ncbi:MAG: FAD binding domain-containing protein [Planctomycetales bacterium]|nr:FAD binding domain-containing protein [Planctomycetales bacterium]
MRPFSHADAGTFADAAAALDRRTSAIAGGTDLVPAIKDGTAAPDRIVNLKTIPGADAIHWDPRAGLRIGALATLADVAAHPAVRRRAPILAEAAGGAATPQIRNVATIAGNLCQRRRWIVDGGPLYVLKGGSHPTFGEAGEGLDVSRGTRVCVSDPATALVALGAWVRVLSANRSRVLPVAHLPDGLRVGELIAEVLAPPAPPGARGAYEKLTVRKGWDFAVASVAVQAVLARGVVRISRVILGGVAGKPWECPGAEAILAGARLDASVAARAGEAAVDDCPALSRSTYRRAVVPALVRRAILRLR